VSKHIGKLSFRSGIANIPTVVWALLAMMVYFSWSLPIFRTWSNIMNILRQGSILITLAMGVIVVKITGGMDLSVGAVMTLSGMVMAWALSTAQFSIWVAVLLCLVVGTACGFLNGVFVALMNIPPFVATLGVQGMAAGLSLVLTGGYVVWIDSDALSFIGSGQLLGISTSIWISLVAFMSSLIILSSTPFGVYIYAIGGNEDALRLVGKQSWWYKILAYTYCGLMAGIAGVVITSRNMAAQPTIGLGMEFEAFAATVLGGSVVSGRGDAFGATLGALFLLILRNGLNLKGVPTYYQLAIIGVAIIVAIVTSMVLDRRLRG